MIISGGVTIGGCFAVSNATPGAPTITSVTTGSRGSGQITIAYTAPAYSGYPGSITGYTAFSRPGCITVSTNTAASGNLTFTGLCNGTPYAFKIYATNCQGNGAFGYYCTYKTVQPICAPTIGSALPGSNPGQVVIYYTAPPYSTGTTITSYTAISTPTGYTGTYIGSGSNSITISCVPQGSTHTFRVYATTAAGGTTPYSSTSNVVTSPGPSYTVCYFMAGGGGGGANAGGVSYSGGGGGAGGVRCGAITLQQYIPYQIVIGAGGSASFAGGITFIKRCNLGYRCVGGGGGGYFGTKNSCGGSGGGGPAGCSGGSINIYLTGIKANNGGAGALGTYGIQGDGGGGGGAGSSGTNAVACSSAGVGGRGTFTNIITTSLSVTTNIGQYITATNAVWFGGGGGGGATGYFPKTSVAPAGGQGGGGAGARRICTAGTTVYYSGFCGKVTTGGGGGGGGGFYSSGAPGGNGGSGVVMFSIPSVSWNGTSTGSRISTTVGSNMVLLFYGSGTLIG